VHPAAVFAIRQHHRGDRESCGDAVTETDHLDLP
jgi:hypothetical protein